MAVNTEIKGLIGCGADLGALGPEACTIFGALLKKKIQNYKYKIRYIS
jgi:hypothetical protein